MISEGDSFNARFSHIYVEHGVSGHPAVKRILGRVARPGTQVIFIDHYKDVFCRRGQDPVAQQKAQSLILAQKQGRLFYPGAQVCQSFGNEYFYYTSCIMNCLYDCEYCYLKGMYPSGHIVLFVNLEQYFQELELLLRKHPVYLCVSYDTDLLAWEDVTGFVERWMAFAADHRGLRMEVRTKCGRTDFWERWKPDSSVVFAFTMSPQQVIEAWEHGTSSLKQRIKSATTAVESGFSVRLCFDPMICFPDWKREYAAMLEEIFAGLPGSALTDVSVGSFRISQDYLKKMRRILPRSVVVQFPFENVKGVYQYPEPLRREMEEFLIERLRREMPEDKIYTYGDL